MKKHTLITTFAMLPLEKEAVKNLVSVNHNGKLSSRDQKSIEGMLYKYIASIPAHGERLVKMEQKAAEKGVKRKTELQAKLSLLDLVASLEPELSVESCLKVFRSNSAAQRLLLTVCYNGVAMVEPGADELDFGNNQESGADVNLIDKVLDVPAYPEGAKQPADEAGEDEQRQTEETPTNNKRNSKRSK